MGATLHAGDLIGIYLGIIPDTLGHPLAILVVDRYPLAICRQHRDQLERTIQPVNVSWRRKLGRSVSTVQQLLSRLLVYRVSAELLIDPPLGEKIGFGGKLGTGILCGPQSCLP